MNKIIYALAAFILMTGCSGDVSSGPAEVIDTFTKAVASGRFDEAGALCDSPAMSEYIETYRQVMEKRAASDSAATAIAAEILEKLEITVTEVSKGKENRTVFYTIEDTYGHKKEKIATMKNEEGEWKVTEIRDRD